MTWRAAWAYAAGRGGVLGATGCGTQSVLSKPCANNTETLRDEVAIDIRKRFLF